MKSCMTDTGLEYQNRDDGLPVGGWIQVIASRVSHFSQSNNEDSCHG